MKILKNLKGFWLRAKSDKSRRQLLKVAPGETNYTSDFKFAVKNPTAYYETSFREFHRSLPAELRKHRQYFQENQRGYGEDAFHVMWWNLIRRFKPQNFLEIGIYRGQTISLVSLITKMEGISCEVHGISPFSSVGDSVSDYLRGIDYLEDTLKNFHHFSLPSPELLKAYSTDDEAVNLIRSRSWDIIYIDGNHDYEIVKADWAVCSEAVETGGLIVLDDSGLTTGYRPPAFATGGHPGPSRLASEIDASRFEEILQVGHNRVFQKQA
ncbi:class I SAM-dependent methyltransferase [Akkermansiaceae bacterium]|nr:class I SAM-dependent methyltransferase [Akkermansiaceae bacterium]